MSFTIKVSITMLPEPRDASASVAAARDAPNAYSPRFDSVVYGRARRFGVRADRTRVAFDAATVPWLPAAALMQRRRYRIAPKHALDIQSFDSPIVLPAAE